MIIIIQAVIAEAMTIYRQTRVTTKQLTSNHEKYICSYNQLIMMNCETMVMIFNLVSSHFQILILYCRGKLRNQGYIVFKYYLVRPIYDLIVCGLGLRLVHRHWRVGFMSLQRVPTRTFCPSILCLSSIRPPCIVETIFKFSCSRSSQEKIISSVGINHVFGVGVERGHFLLAKMSKVAFSKSALKKISFFWDPS